ncbi:ankyrin [Melanomma pulvis-pyrius CBS 109.77]|uniref:Ankyrin n=1 Tax=Melanomma pulvis-pyrius CBS 109.77 TaxID=1314802 RepID=A0A6A6WZI3_9PLEO|nr:ankyrin [Melanomma pulvis-pyrius CBS 109.77]
MLLEHGFNANTVDHHGDPCIFQAVIHNITGIVRMLLHWGASMNEDHWISLVSDAASISPVDIVSMLLDHLEGKHDKRWRIPPLQIALESAVKFGIEQKRFTLVQYLLKRGTSFKYTGPGKLSNCGALAMATATVATMKPSFSDSNYMDTINLFLDHGYDINAPQVRKTWAGVYGSPWRAVFRFCNHSMLDLLLGHNGFRPLEFALIGRSFFQQPAVVMHLRSGAKSPSALHLAVLHDRRNLIKLLLDYNVDRDQESDFNWPLMTPVEYARKTQKWDCLRILKEYVPRDGRLTEDSGHSKDVFHIDTLLAYP